MYFHIQGYIYICLCRNSYILLDIRRDNYYIFSEEDSFYLNCVLKYEFLKNTEGYIPVQKIQNFNQKKFTKLLETVFEQEIIFPHLYPECYPYLIDQKPNSIGMPNIDWRLTLRLIHTDKTFSNVVIALYYLTYIHFLVKFKGFKALITIIKKHKPIKYILPSAREIENLQNCLNKACKIFPIKTKCLEWAATLCLMFLKRDWYSNIVIGVQNYPFMAHAWVEVDNTIIGDDPKLRDGLSIILKEPFRPVVKS